MKDGVCKMVTKLCVKDGDKVVCVKDGVVVCVKDGVCVCDKVGV